LFLHYYSPDHPEGFQPFSAAYLLEMLLPQNQPNNVTYVTVWMLADDIASIWLTKM
jgi:hypothetical protein